MRRKEREITDKKIIEEILQKSSVCRIALNNDEFPYIVPLNHGYADNALYFHSATQGKKINLIRKDNKVSFEVELAGEIITGKEACQWTTKYRSVTGQGKIKIITDIEGKKEGLDVIMGHHGGQTKNYQAKHLENLLILKLDITKISGKQAGSW